MVLEIPTIQIVTATQLEISTLEIKLWVQRPQLLFGFSGHSTLVPNQAIPHKTRVTQHGPRNTAPNSPPFFKEEYPKGEVVPFFRRSRRISGRSGDWEAGQVQSGVVNSRTTCNSTVNSQNQFSKKTTELKNKLRDADNLFRRKKKER